MLITDRHGNAVSAVDRAALDALDDAVELMLGYRDPMATLDAALLARPDFAMGHAVRAGLLAMSMERAFVAEAEQAVAAAWMASNPNPREAAHLAAAQAWCDGDFAGAQRAYVDLAADHPRDLFAQQAAQVFSFMVGDRAALRDVPERALQAWREGESGFAWLRGMQAFGLEENGALGAAEEAGRHAISLQPQDAWAVHAVAHVMEMQGRDEEGRAFLRATEADWAPAGVLAVHNWWHLALFHLERGETAEVLRLYDDAIAPGVMRGEAQPAIDLVDASAMLWRLLLRGADTGRRFGMLSAAWEMAGGEGFYVFNDLHAIMAHLGAGRREAAAEVMGAMRRAAAGQGAAARTMREVGLGLADALMAFARGDYGLAAGLITLVGDRAMEAGGSNAQRDVFALTQLEAALRGGERSLARLLADARLRAKPRSPLARAFAARVPGPALAA